MNPRSIRTGTVAAASLLAFYTVVVAGSSGSWTHLTDQARQDWYYLVLIIAGFATQVTLISELRRRHRLHRRDRQSELRFEAAGSACGTARLTLAGFPDPVEATWDLGG